MSRAGMGPCGGGTINFVPDQLRGKLRPKNHSCHLAVGKSSEVPSTVHFHELKVLRGALRRWRSIFCSNVTQEHDRLLVVNQQVMIKAQTWFISFCLKIDFIFSYIQTHVCSLAGLTEASPNYKMRFKLIFYSLENLLKLWSIIKYFRFPNRSDLYPQMLIFIYVVQNLC